jgi:hypothetical protein
LKVTGKRIYLDREPSSEERAAGVVYQPDGRLSQPDLVNTRIEDAGTRARIPAGQGNICISIAPGDELGELTFNVQFEGRRGDYDFCLDHHNKLLQDVAQWLQDILAAFGTQFEVELESRPCPKTEKRVALDLAAQILEDIEHLARSEAEHESVEEVEHQAGHKR